MLSGTLMRYLAGDKVYRGGSNASHIGVKNKAGFRERDLRNRRKKAIQRRLAAKRRGH
jgi:hypothetical protein